MAQPTWLAYWFAALMVSVSVYCIGRLALASHLNRRDHTDVSVERVLMGFAMVGMLVPHWNVLAIGLWETVFAAMALYFLGRSLRFQNFSNANPSAGNRRRQVTHNLIHMVMACAMLYMYWLGMPIVGPAQEATAMSGPPRGVGDPALTLFLIAVLVVSAVWHLDTLGRFSTDPQLALAYLGGSPPSVGADSASGAGSAGYEPVWLAPRLEIGCHIIMVLTMAYMLVLMT